ncbi:MAG: hypothetical protein RL404_1413, partial [Pseudomonadota bacterium]
MNRAIEIDYKKEKEIFMIKLALFFFAAVAFS